MMRFVGSVVAYTVVTFAIAYPWHLVWFKDAYDKLELFTRDEPIIAMGMLAILSQAVVFSYLYPRLYRGGHPLKEGVQHSLVLGMLVYSAMGFATVAKFDVASIPGFLLLHTPFQILQFVAVGLAIGLVHGRVNGAKEDTT
jgi:hypothetical protein